MSATDSAVPPEAAWRDVAQGFDLANLPERFYDDPFPVYHALRRHDPLHRCPDGSYFLTRYADVDQVYREHEAWSSDKKVEFKPKYGDSPLFEHHTTSLVFRDPPDHTKLRRIFAAAFTPRALAALEARVVDIVEGLLDRGAEAGRLDIIEDYAFALPVELIGDMLGVPRDERWRLRGWSLAILGALEPVLTDERRDAGNRAIVEFKAFLVDLLDHRRRNPDGAADGEILSAFIAAEADGGISELDILHQCIFLLNAGHETTTNLIGNGSYELLHHPDELARLRADPNLIDSCVEECLRYQSPNQLGNRRAVADTDVGGVAMPAGSLVTMCIGAANRDPDVFPEPDRFDISRTPNRHRAFGMGIHICAGNSLARMEGRVAISRLFERFTVIEPAGPAPRSHRARFRGLTSFPVRLHAAG